MNMGRQAAKAVEELTDQGGVVAGTLIRFPDGRAALVDVCGVIKGETAPEPVEDSRKEGESE